MTDYQKYFQKKMQEWKINSPEDLKDEKKKKDFFEDVDKGWKAEEESDGKQSKVWKKIENVIFSKHQ